MHLITFTIYAPKHDSKTQQKQRNPQPNKVFATTQPSTKQGFFATTQPSTKQVFTSAGLLIVQPTLLCNQRCYVGCASEVACGARRPPGTMPPGNGCQPTASQTNQHPNVRKPGM
jgi:hypothetical protein